MPLYCTTATPTIISTDMSATSTVWVSWIDSTVTNCNYTGATNIIWSSWINLTHEQQAEVLRHQAAMAAQRQANLETDLTDRQWLERRRQRQANLETERKYSEAEERARVLLREHLTDRQREALDRHGWFLVEGGKSKKEYRVRGSSCAGNITELREGREVSRLCVHSDYSIPLSDQLLTQLLHLRHDEEHMMQRANRTALG